MTNYLLNALSTTMLPDRGVVEFTNLDSASSARDALTSIRDEPDFTSAVGHEGTADVFSALLRLPVQAARVMITLKPGDWAVVGQINTRLPEGKVLSARELANLPIRWVLVHVKDQNQEGENVHLPYHCNTCANGMGEFCDAK